MTSKELGRVVGNKVSTYTLALFLGPGFPRDLGSPFAAPLLIPFFPGGPIGPGVPLGAGVPGFESDTFSPFAWVGGWLDACGDPLASAGGVAAFSFVSLASASASADAGESSLAGRSLQTSRNLDGETVRVTVRPLLPLLDFRPGAMVKQGLVWYVESDRVEWASNRTSLGKRM